MVPSLSAMTIFKPNFIIIILFIFLYGMWYEIWLLL